MFVSAMLNRSKKLTHTIDTNVATPLTQECSQRKERTSHQETPVSAALHQKSECSPFQKVIIATPWTIDAHPSALRVPLDITTFKANSSSLSSLYAIICKGHQQYQLRHRFSIGMRASTMFMKGTGSEAAEQYGKGGMRDPSFV